MPPSAFRHFQDAPPAFTGLIGLLGLLALFLWWPIGLRTIEIGSFLLFLTLLFLLMVISDLQSGAARTVGFRRFRLRACTAADLDRLFAKLVGLAAIAAALVGFYASAAIYQDAWYQRLLEPAFRYAPILLALSIVYVVAADLVLARPEDGLSDLGRVLLRLRLPENTERLNNFLAGVLVKAFFLPLMFGYGLDDWRYFQTVVPVFDSFRDLFEYLYRLLFFIDVVFAIIGYATASRLLGSQVRLTELTFRGWAVCLVCYAPFWQVIGRSYLNYGNEIVWGSILAPYPALYVLWGSLILIVIAVYVSATVIFGLRFSNLTYRGTVHRGPYALFRHPAYMFKILSFAMIDLPFLGQSAQQIVTGMLAFLGLAGIYYARAWHEERCCARAREYRLYLRYMKRHGMLERLARRFRRAANGKRRGLTPGVP